MALVAAVAAFSAACAENQKPAARPAGTPVQLQTATKQQLVEAYNAQAKAIHSINATISIKLTAGTQYSGVIKQYHQVNGFILAQEPSSVRVIGQAPIVGTNIFDMVSDGETFHIFIPSQHRFITGPASLQRQSAKPIENLRPQHLTGAIFWDSIPDRAPLLIEEAADESTRYYVLTVVRTAGSSTADAVADWEIAQRIWFDRANLSVARVQTYEPAGKLGSDVSYSGWGVFGTVSYPRQITLSRPDNDYKLRIGVKKVTFNETISAERFVLQQPPGTELVNAGEDSQQTKPGEQKP